MLGKKTLDGPQAHPLPPAVLANGLLKDLGAKTACRLGQGIGGQKKFKRLHHGCRGPPGNKTHQGQMVGAKRTRLTFKGAFTFQVDPGVLDSVARA